MPFVYDDPTRMKILPLKAITVYYDGGAGSDSVTFDLLEEDSTCRIAPLVRPTDKGSKLQRIVAYEVDVTAICPVNDFDDMRVPLGQMTSGTILSVHVVLEALEGQASGATMELSFYTDLLDVYEWSAEWKVEQANVRPRVTIDVHGLFSTDLFDRAGDDSGVFHQIDW